MSKAAWVAAFFVAWAGAARAQSDPDLGDYLNLSFSGDGETPSAMELMARVDRTAKAAQTAAGATEQGDATYSVPIALPPARHAPSVALSYNSGGGVGRLGRGWSLSVGLQIVQPTGAQALEYDAPTFLVQGGGLDGALVDDGSSLVWVSPQPGALVASYDTPTRTWTVEHGGVTYTLEPAFDVDWDTLGQEPTRWRLARSVDGSGNRVDYSWGGSRINSIAYGGTGPAGTAPAGEEHFLEVGFHYSGAGADFRSASGGVLEIFDERLTAVEIRSAYGRASAIPRLRYELFYDATYELVEQIDQVEILEDGTEGASRMLAAFSYTELHPGAETAETSAHAPALLGQHVSSSSVDGSSTSQMQATLVDSSGDGLPDLVSSLLGWISAWQRIDFPDPEDPDVIDRWWEDPYDPQHEVLSPGGHLDETRTVVLVNNGADITHGTYGLRRWLDINGDGFTDLVVSPALPVAWDEDADPAATNGDPSPTTWEVWYGGLEAFPDPPVAEPAPFPFPLVTERPRLPESNWHPGTYPLEGATVDLMDVNGDGWADVVQVVPLDTLRVWYRIPGEGQGWESTPVDLQLSTPDGLYSLQASTGHVLNYDDWPTWEYVSAQSQQVPMFVFMDATTGFLDVNGDGAIDLVDARRTETTGSWEVWFGTGEGHFSSTSYSWPSPVPWISRTDEGEPFADVCSIPDPELEEEIFSYVNENADDGGVTPERGHMESTACDPRLSNAGRPQSLVGGLLDMDGDGRQDLVDGEAGVWHRNRGDGFDLAGTALPGWFPRADVGKANEYTAGAGILSRSSTYQRVTVGSQPQYPPAPGDASASQALIEQHVVVRDIDRDGLPDVVDIREPSEPVVAYSGRSEILGQLVGGTRPGLLNEVILGAGATTALEYRSSAVMWPAGTDFVVHYFTGRKDVVSAVEVYDDKVGEWGWASREERTYRHAWARRGRFLGFKDVDVDYFSWEADLDSGDPATEWSWLGGTETRYTYSNGGHWPRPKTRTVLTDRQAGFLPGGSGATDPYERRLTEWDYTWEGLDTVLEAPWIESVQVTEFNERRSDPTDVVGRMFELQLTYDAVGNVTSQHHTAVASPQDELLVETEWVGDASGALWVPRWIRTSSYDPVNGGVRPVEEAWFAYDGGTTTTAPTAGLLTRQRVCGGPAGTSLCDPADWLEWEFFRTPRGAVTEIQAPAGRDTFYAQHAFGETVALEEGNALWPVPTVRQVDDLGRIWEEIDPNGVGRRTYADAFGRTTRTEVKGAGAAAWRVETTTTYQDATVPNYVTTDTTVYLPDGTVDTVLSEHQLLDGFGQVIQTWSPAETGFVVQETEHDARGSLRLTTEPHRLSTFTSDYATTRNPVVQSYSYYDLFGDPLLSWNIASGLTAYEHPLPGSTLASMEEYYDKEEVTDTLGRLTEVWQGQPALFGTMTRTGAYAYDGRDRVRTFTDAAGNTHEYDLDGAGRTRQVWRTPVGGLTEAYYGFLWSGPDPIEMYEGLAGTGALVVEWFYDPLGRTEQKDVYDPLTGGTLTWQWAWDEAVGKPTWYGARQSTVDPSGSVTYTYDPDPVFGGFGWPTTVQRDWTISPGGPAVFDYTYDHAGRVTQQTWPSGAMVDHTFHPNGWPEHDELLTAVGDAMTVTHDYDAYGLPDDWTADLNAGSMVWTQDLTRSSSQQPDYVEWTESPSGFTQTVQWTWLANGWLGAKIGILPETITYGYDDLGRITSVDNGSLGLLETYTYDLGHNPTEYYRRAIGPTPGAGPDDVWTYAAAPRFNEVPSRTRPLPGGGVVADTFTYDPATSRLKVWDTTDPANGNIYRDYVYDGAGHLSQVTRQEPAFFQTTSMHYDVDDNLVYEQQTRTGASTQTSQTWRFQGWKKDGATSRVTEQVLPMVRLDGANVRVVLAELDGHALRTRAAAAAPTFEVLGAYGMPVLGVGSTATWSQDHLHGGELDRDDELIHFGARHLAQRDGLWMQPEPLLHLGLTNGDLSNPIKFSGLYSAGNTNLYQDRSGYSAVGTAVVVYTTYSWRTVGAAAGGAITAVGTGVAKVAGHVAGASAARAVTSASVAAGDTAADLVTSIEDVPMAPDALSVPTGIEASKGAPTGGSGRTFVTDPDGNTLIVPEGGRVTGSPDGSFVQTRRADGSISQRKDQAHRDPAPGEAPSSQDGTAPHGHGMDADGNSLDVDGNIVDRTSPEAHWDAR